MFRRGVLKLAGGFAVLASAPALAQFNDCGFGICPNGLLPRGGVGGIGAAPNPLPKWTAAKSLVNAGTRNAKLLLIGDSTTQGFGSVTSPGTINSTRNGWPAQLAPLLSATINASNSSFFASNGSPGATTADSLKTFAGGTGQAGTSIGGTFYTEGSAATISFAPPNAFDKIDVWYPGGFGSVSVNVDGGATLATIPATGSGYIKTTITVPGGLTTHTLNLVWVSGTFFVGGVVVYNSSSKEVSIYNTGNAGSLSAAWINNGSVFAALPAASALAPDLTIIMAGINDWNAGTALATVQSNLQTLITACKVSGDVILISGVPSNPATKASVATQLTYINMMSALATTNGIPFLSLTTVFGSWATANGNSLMFDDLHPNFAGYTLIANQILNLVK